MKKLIYWLPRVLTIIYILFLALFAFDVFEGDQSVWKKSLGFLIHLAPNFLLIIILIISWKREWIAGILFNVLAIFYIVFFWGRFALSAYFVIAGPLFLTGILFFVNWYQRKNDMAHKE
ncbi:MAG: hypothetical protein AB7S50_08985 [Bacteroidales bacterium]